MSPILPIKRKPQLMINYFNDSKNYLFCHSTNIYFTGKNGLMVIFKVHIIYNYGPVIICGVGGRVGGSKVVDEFRLLYISLSPTPLLLTLP